MSPTARTLKLLRDWGLLAAVVETWVPVVNRRRDLFGGFDVLAIDPRDKRVWLIQCTSTANVATRIKKLQGLPVTPKLIAAGVRCEVWGWGRRASRWDVRRVELTSADCSPVELTPRPRRGGKKPKQKSLFC